MYNNYIEPRGLIHDADFLTHDFMPTMLDALGLQDTSGVIFEVVEHDYFNITDLGVWDQMMPGMINVSSFRHLLRQSRLLLRAEFLEGFLCRTDYGGPMKPFFIEIQNFWAWADKLGR